LLCVSGGTGTLGRPASAPAVLGVQLFNMISLVGDKSNFYLNYSLNTKKYIFFLNSVQYLSALHDMLNSLVSNLLIISNVY
jgi:hypothetical protein